nr:unnamed protein product [Digitaria exilis]
MESGGWPTLDRLLCLAWLAAILLIAATIALPIPAAAGGRVVRRWLCTIASRGKTFRSSSSKAGSLREHKNSDEYVIPCGDWFSYVSCPHYLAEIVMYFGLLIASGGSSSSVWFLLIFVVHTKLVLFCDTNT